MTSAGGDGEHGLLLSAAIIVRDEADHLAACLDSLAGIVDEAVVVDTGSLDDSVAVAEERGARVTHHDWDGDFSAARNVGLEQVRGRWVLYIDADERLRPIQRALLAALLDGTDAVAFRVLLHPFVGSTPYLEYRLWRNDPRIRFRGVIHEKVAPAIADVAAADGRPVEACDLTLDHYGYEGDQTAKHRRNLPLLRAQLEAEPDNVFNWRHLARVLAGLDHRDEAEQALERAVALARAELPPSDHGSLAWADLVRLRWDRRDDVDALLADGLARWPDNWLLVWIEGQVLAGQGRHEEAIERFRRLLALDVPALAGVGVAYDARIFGPFAHASIGLSLFRLGRYAESGAAYAAAEELDPAQLDYRVKRQLAEARVGPG